MKQKSRAVKAKKAASSGGDGDETASAASKQVKFVFETLGLEIPKENNEQTEALQRLLDQETTYDTLVQQAVDAIKAPTKLPLTRVQGDDDRSKQNRSKLLQAALAQAQASNSDESSSSDPSKLLGFHAAVVNAEEQSGQVRQTKDCYYCFVFVQ